MSTSQPWHSGMQVSVLPPCEWWWTTLVIQTLGINVFHFTCQKRQRQDSASGRLPLLDGTRMYQRREIQWEGEDNVKNVNRTHNALHVAKKIACHKQKMECYKRVKCHKPIIACHNTDIACHKQNIAYHKQNTTNIIFKKLENPPIPDCYLLSCTCFTLILQNVILIILLLKKHLF